MTHKRTGAGPQGRSRLADSHGRTVVLRGTNVVYKAHPHVPTADAFNALTSLSHEDGQLLAALGVTIVRLGCLWAATHPLGPHFDPRHGAYLAAIAKIVRHCALHRIHVIIDFHQDLLASRFLGHGLPAWVATDFPANHNNHTNEQDDDTSKSSSTNVSQTPSFIRRLTAFPFPIAKPIPYNRLHPVTRKPLLQEDVEHLVWYKLYFAVDVGRAADALYHNRNGARDLFCQFWGQLASFFTKKNVLDDVFDKDNCVVDSSGNKMDLLKNLLRTWDNILAFDMINEPWPGNIYKNPSLLLPGVASGGILHQFQSIVADHIRSIDNTRCIMFEGCTWDIHHGANTIPTTGLISAELCTRSIYSFHYYRPPQRCGPERFLLRKLEDARRMGGCPMVLTEWEMWAGKSEVEQARIKSGKKELSKTQENIKLDKIHAMWRLLDACDSVPSHEALCKFIEKHVRLADVTPIEATASLLSERILYPTEPQSSCGWSYKAFSQGEDSADAGLFVKYPEHTIEDNYPRRYLEISKKEESEIIFDDRFGVRLSMMQLFGRYYPHATPGRLLNFQFDRSKVQVTITCCPYRIGGNGKLPSNIIMPPLDSYKCTCLESSTHEECAINRLLEVRVCWTPWSFIENFEEGNNQTSDNSSSSSRNRNISSKDINGTVIDSNDNTAKHYLDLYTDAWKCTILPLNKVTGRAYIPHKYHIKKLSWEFKWQVLLVPGQFIADTNEDANDLLRRLKLDLSKRNGSFSWSKGKTTTINIPYIVAETSQRVFPHVDTLGKDSYLDKQQVIPITESLFIEAVILPRIEGDPFCVLTHILNDEIRSTIKGLRIGCNLYEDDTRWEVVVVTQIALK